MHHRSPRGASTLRRLFLLAASCGLAVVGWFLLGETESQSLAATPPRPVLARLDGVDITEDEVNELAADALAELAETRHRLILETTRDEVRRRLLRAEAERRGINPEELLAAEVDGPASGDGRQASELYDALIARLEQSYGVEYLIRPAAGADPASALDAPPDGRTPGGRTPAIARLAPRR